MSQKPSFPANVTVVIKKQTKTFNATTHNAEYVWTEVYNGEAWKYNVNDWLVENSVPISRRSTALLVPSISADIDETCALTIDGVAYRIIDAIPQRNYNADNHRELRVERRNT